MTVVLKQIDSDVFSFYFENDIKQIAQIETIVETIQENWKLNDKVQFTLNLVLEELICNVILYGFKVVDEHQFIKVDIRLLDTEIIINIIDNGAIFNPLEHQSAPKETSLEEKAIGGLGIHLVKSMTNYLKYNRINEQNQLTLSIPIIIES